MALYDRERVEKIGQIMPRFSEHVEVGDEILLGLEGDPMFPAKYNENRPKGTVMKVKQLDGGASIRVRMDNGNTVTLKPGELDPQKVWEFSDESFQRVLERSLQPEPTPEQEMEPPNYRSSFVSEMGSMSEVQQLRQELAMLKSQYENDQMEARQFNNTLIATMNEVAQDVCAVNSNAGFCNVFANEYRSMMKPEGAASASPPDKMFESDFSDSSDEE